MKNLASFFFFISFFFPYSGFAASLTVSKISQETKPLHYLKVSVPQNFDCTSLSFGVAERAEYFDTTIHPIYKAPLYPKPSWVEDSFCVFDFKEGLTPQSTSTVTYFISYDENNPPLFKTEVLEGDKEVFLGTVSLSGSGVSAITAFGEEKASFVTSFCSLGDYSPHCRFIPASFSGVTLRNLPEEALGSITLEVEENSSFDEKGGCPSLSFFESSYNSFYNFYTYTKLRIGTQGENRNTCTFFFPQGFKKEEGKGYGVLMPSLETPLVLKTRSTKENLPDTFVYEGVGLLCCGGGNIPTLSFTLSDPLFFSKESNEGDEALSIDVDVTPFCSLNCNSNILFLPGIMGSKLYEKALYEGTPIDIERWFSMQDFYHERLSLDENGYSVHDVYTKEGGVIDETVGQNIYKSFLGDLEELKKDGSIENYAAVPYDWRLSAREIVKRSKKEGERIYYGSTGEESYVLSSLRELARTSRTGKVTIVAHSNGGLVTKALLQKLKDSGDPLYEKIDKIIFVAVPQVGTPDAVVALLHGTNIGPGGIVISSKKVRDLFHSMPGMYSLLPSKTFFPNLSPLISFSPSQMIQKSYYGDSVDNYKEYIDFLEGKEGRGTPSYDDTEAPAKAIPKLLEEAENLHENLDSWLPPPNTKVYQIAGWGMYTAAGIAYKDLNTCTPAAGLTGEAACTPGIKASPQIKKSLNGDGTVLAGSAQMMGDTDRIKRFWVDLKKYSESGFQGSTKNRNHKDILEVDTLRSFISNIITKNDDSPLEYISTEEPPAPLDKDYTEYQIHSPLYLTAIDDKGNITGYASTTGRILEDIPGSQYLTIGEVKTILLPASTKHTVYLTAYDSGSFTLITSTLSGEKVKDTTTLEAVPTSTTTRAIIFPKEDGKMDYKIDFNGDGLIEKEVNITQGETLRYQVEEKQKVSTCCSASYSLPTVSSLVATLQATSTLITTSSIKELIEEKREVSKEKQKYSETKMPPLVISKGKLSVTKKTIASTLQENKKGEIKKPEIGIQKNTPKGVSQEKKSTPKETLWEKIKKVFRL